MPIKIVTQSRTYLYKYGEEYTELTGGWKRGNYNIGTFTKESDHMNLQGSFPATNVQYWNSCQTTNSVNVKDFKKIVYKLQIDNMKLYNGTYVSWLLFGVFNPQFVNYNSHRRG